MKKILAIVLTVCMLFCLCACGGDKNGPTNNENIDNKTQSDTSSKEDITPKFEVVVLCEDVGVKGVMVQLCKDSCVPAVTNENGIAVFNIEVTDGYKLSVMSCPDGYEYTGEAEIYLDEGETQYELEISKK